MHFASRKEERVQQPNRQTDFSQLATIHIALRSLNVGARAVPQADMTSRRSAKRLPSGSESIPRATSVCPMHHIRISVAMAPRLFREVLFADHVSAPDGAPLNF